MRRKAQKGARDRTIGKKANISSMPECLHTLPFRPDSWNRPGFRGF